MRHIFTSEAEDDLVYLAAFWARARTKARPLDVLVDGAVRRLLVDPASRAVYERVEGVEVRRVRVHTTPYHLYYFIDEDEDGPLVVIVSAWSGQREKGPPLGKRL